MKTVKAYVRTNAMNLAFVVLALGACALGIVDPASTLIGVAGVTGLAPFPVQEDLTAIALMYRNRSMIADEVMPRVPVSAQAFKYFAHDLADGFSIPDTKVGRTSAPNRVEFKATETAGQTDDYALDDPIPQADLDNAQSNPNIMDPRAKATEFVSNLIELDREVRVANAAFNAANYGAAYKVTLAGTSQWSDFTNSDPLAAMLNALDSMVMRANILVLGQSVWTKLSTHPKLVKAFNGSFAGDQGKISKQFLAELLEIDAVYVGQAWVNTAKRGQAASLARAWGKSAAFIYRDRLADATRGTTWGFTAQWGTRIAGSIPDPHIGMRGGEYVRVGESVKEIITAPDLGYLFSAAVA